MTRPLVIALLAVAAAGCTSPSGPSGNGIVRVVNLGATPVTLGWREAGGSSGTEPVDPCREWARGFGPGVYELTLTANGVDRTFTLVAPANGSQTLGLVVAADGGVRESGEPFPTSSC